ncbi:MAG: hypothetical protein IKC45_00585 [Clostridia bacterium]|nr:hypothetical protein [Clostridia bacterium]
MSIIYVIVKVLTLPGAILHAFFEHMVCRSAKIIVEDERVVQFNEMLSHVDHQLIKRKGPSFDICFIPFFMNFILGFLTLSYGSTAIIYFAKYEDIFAWICLYFGISLLTNLFPQIEDVMMLKENYLVNNDNKLNKALVTPWYGIFWLGARIEKCGLTLLTSVGFAFLVPVILGWFIPALYGILK